MGKRSQLGGVVHTYQKYDPRELPGPTQPPPDVVSSAFEHMLMYGQRRAPDARGAGAGRADRHQ